MDSELFTEHDSKIFLADVFKIHEIFQVNNWFSKPGQDQVHKNLVEMLVGFSEDQKQLMFELCERYIWISMNEYIELLVNTLEMVEDFKLKETKRIILFPIVKPADIHKVKSSSPLLYSFKAAYFGGRRYNNIEFKVLDTFKSLDKEVFVQTDLLFLVDDFIGTGDTLNATLDEVLKNKSIQSNQINILALVAQEQTINSVTDRGFASYIKHQIKRGISDHYKNPDLENKVKAMKELELLIPRIKNFEFGYGQSEALVTMNRTPNNTFPIFWKSHKRGGKNYKAPFPRNYGK